MKNINVTALTVIYEEVIMTHNCVKSVQIRSYFWSVFSCIRTSNNSVFGLFSPSDSLQNCKLIRVIKKPKERSKDLPLLSVLIPMIHVSTFFHICPFCFYLSLVPLNSQVLQLFFNR